MLENIRIVVLHTIKYKESGVIVQGYSDRNGRESFFLKRSRNSKRGSLISQLHPLSIIEATPSSHSFGDMTTIREFFLPYRLESIRSNIFKSSIAIFISELLYKTIKEVEYNHKMYLFLTDAILRLEAINDGAVNFHVYFTVMLCKHLGYLPQIKGMPDNCLFDIPSASYASSGGELSFDAKNSAMLARLALSDYNSISEIKMTGTARGEFIKEMLRYLSFHSGYGIDIESLDVLHQVFE